MAKTDMDLMAGSTGVIYSTFVNFWRKYGE